MKAKLLLAGGVLVPLLLLSSAPTACALPAVQVYGQASSTGEHVTVNLYTDILDTSIVSYTARVFYDPGALRVLQAARSGTAFVMLDGSVHAPYMQPDASQPGEVLFVGGHFDSADPSGGVTGTHLLLGTIVFGRVSSVTPKFAVTIGREGQFASFVTTNGTVLEASAGTVSFADVSADPSDTDLDGLADQWEIRYFKSTDLAFFSDDPDGDQYNDYAEQAWGTDPTNHASHLNFGITPQPNQLILKWTSATGRIYAIESSGPLPGFSPLKTGILATPPSNMFAVPVSGGDPQTFYRIHLESAGQR